MSKSDDVRFTRDGDQFHYLWAARQCLKLLSPTTSLAAITIEGASASEVSDGNNITAGEEVIDVAEYHGSTDLARASSVRYIQLKHSTVNATDPWTMSGLEKTLAGFSKRFQALRQTEGLAAALKKLTFVFATNRPISSDVYNAIADAVSMATPRDARASNGLERYTALRGSDLASFCALISLESEQDGFLAQRKALTSDLRSYLAGGDSEAFLEIKELVTRKATSEFAKNPSITKFDILRALGKDEEDLFPAPNRISLPNLVIPRTEEQTLVRRIVDAGSSPVVVHAEGGVGKSVFASRIGLHLPRGSVSVVYDCFGNGEYRAPSHPRHGARQALVQIANELAAAAHCHPIVPSSHADDAAYFRAFCARVSQTASSIQQVEKIALLCIVIDAADNAEMAAAESGDAESFARKLIRETFPSGVRIVMLCRTHRRHLLNPPPSVNELPLPVFSWDETATKLRGVFPDASDQDVHEFHRLSSQNPRVQQTALATATDVHAMLRDLGPEPKTVDDMISRLLQQAVGRVKEEVPRDLLPKFDRICTALAVLRPMIPLSVMASLVQIDTDNLRSFLADLGQSVLIKGELLQFRDEPTEGWFQSHFKPTAEALRDFIAVLRPQATKSAYVAAALPHLMLSAGQIDELIEAALNSSDLPTSNTLERRNVEAQRLHFALRASLRSRRYLDATKLGLTAAGLAAAEDRQWKALQANTDLAGRFLEPEQVLSLVAERVFGGGWRGAHHAYDASVLSSVAGFHGDAQSHIRMAEEWIRNLRTLPVEQRQQERIEASDIAALVLANLNIYGHRQAVVLIGRCITSSFRHEVSSVVARRLTDGNRLGDLDAMSVEGAKDTVLLAALIDAAASVGHLLPPVGVRRAWKALSRLQSQAQRLDVDLEGNAPTMLTAFAWMGIKLRVCSPEDAAMVMNRHLGVDRLRSLGYQHDQSGPALIKAYVFKAKLSGRISGLVDLAHPDWHKSLAREEVYSDKREIREFRVRARALMPWYQLWADITLEALTDEDIRERLARAKKDSDRALGNNYWDRHQLKNHIAIAHAEVLSALQEKSLSHIDSLHVRLSENDYFTSTLTSIVWKFARNPTLKDFALDLSNRIATQLESQSEHAETRVDSWVALSRALIPAHENEAKHFFSKSLEVAAKIGDENLWRWTAMIHLANAASAPDEPKPELAYRIARSAELTYDFVYRDKHFDWQGTVEAVANLCPFSAFAILSRWRDRGFGSCQRLLAILVEHLLLRDQLDPSLAAALYGFQAQWSAAEVFAAVMQNSRTESDLQKRADFLYEYIRLQNHDRKSWAKIQETAKNFNITLPDLDSFVHFAEHRASSAASLATEKQQDSHSSVPVDWPHIFNGLDIPVLSELTEAYRRYSDVKTYDRRTDFYEQAALRVPVGREADFLKSLENFPAFELYELNRFITRFPAAWRRQFSTMTGLKSLVKVLTARHCLRISLDRHYQPLRLEMVEREAKIPMAETIQVALDATAEHTHQLSAETLFQLVGLLANKLDDVEAADALDLELNRLEAAMEAGLGDGPWNTMISPPKDIDFAVAGYVWAALAVPESEYRWQAAHVVRALCRLECERCVDYLVLWLTNPPVEQFVDRRLVHYRLHAVLWLLIGLGRAALDHAEHLKKYSTALVDCALNKERPHVLIRGFAARVALAIAARCNTSFDDKTLLALRSVNDPIVDPNAATRVERLRKGSKSSKPADSLALHFGIDMPSYWFEPLATIFGISTDDFCLRAQSVICGALSTSPQQWDNDKRYDIRYYEHEHTRHSHGSYPKSDDLRFYLSFHSMFIVAGELLLTVPTPPASDDDYYDTFEYWLREYELTRPDGFWLSDRRDPEPFDYSNYFDNGDSQEWKWCVAKEDFEKFLFFEHGFVSVSASWTHINGSKRQEVSIESALVSSESAHALLVASQTASDFRFRFSIPRSSESADETIVPGFELIGWILREDRKSDIDHQDPWCADIHFPPLRPSDFAGQLLGLAGDRHWRNWHRSETNELAIRSRTWGSSTSGQQTEEEGNHGLLLQATFESLHDLVAKTEKSIIFSVSISRRLASSYQKDEELDIKYPPPYVRYFILDKNGKFTSF